MDKLRTAVVGVGDFGARHLDVLANMQGVEVVALVEVREDRVREMAARYNVPHVFQTVEEMLASVRLDTIHIATPDTRHLAPALEALRVGVEVFLEKPISYDLN